MSLVLGNHDRSAGVIPNEWRMELLPPQALRRPFIFCHEPQEHENGHVLCGHVHPVVRLRKKKLSMRLPCFHLRKGCMIWPAFGSFTGGFVVKVEPDDRVFALTSDQVISLPPEILS